MAELLIMAKPDTNNELRYQRGDVVQVYEDGTCKEPPAPGSRFVIVRLPGVSVEGCGKLIEPRMEETGELSERGEPVTVMTKRRRATFSLDALDKSIVDVLEEGREITLKESEIVSAKSVAVDKLTAESVM